MTTKIKELIDQLTNNITTQNDILEILDVVDAKTCNIVAQCLIPQIKSRVEMLTSNVKAFIEMLTDYDTNNDVDPSKFTYDVMYPDGRIEIGLHSPSKEKLLELLSICTSSKDIQILRVIDSNGKIIESNKPHFTDACFKSGFGNSIYNPITDSRLIEEFSKKELPKDEKKEIVENFVTKSLPKIVDDLNNLCEKKPTPKKKSSKKNKKTKKV